MTDAADYFGRWCSRRPRRTLSETLGEVRSRPMTPGDFERPNGFDSDEEVEEFLDWLSRTRGSDHV